MYSRSSRRQNRSNVKSSYSKTYGRASNASQKSGQRRRGAPRYDGIVGSISTSPLIKAASTQTVGAYLKAVVDPEHNPHCHIPDLSSFPCQTFTTKAEVPFGPNGEVNSSIGLKVDLGPYPRWAFTTPTSTQANFEWSEWQTFNFSDSMVSNYQAVRLVGASIRLEFGGNDQNNAGFLTGISLGRYSTLTNELGADVGINTIPDSLEQMRNSRDSIVVPYKEGLYITYRPLDASAFNFKQTKAFTAATAADSGWGTLIACLNGATNNSAVGLMYVTFHWEGISKISTSSAGAGEMDTSFTNFDEIGPTQSLLTNISSMCSGIKIVDGTLGETCDQAVTVLKTAVGGYKMLQSKK